MEWQVLPMFHVKRRSAEDQDQDLMFHVKQILNVYLPMQNRLKMFSKISV
jgi:hypothetical protein